MDTDDGFVMPVLRGPATWGPSHRGAYKKGWEAGAAGLGEDSCPYSNKAKRGNWSWGGLHARAWRDGWLAARSAGG